MRRRQRDAEGGDSPQLPVYRLLELSQGNRMSYNIYIYNRTVFDQVKKGLELDGFKLEPISQPDMARFLKRLQGYHYEKRTETAICTEFLRDVSGCPIQVAVFRTEIAFSVPSWKNSEAAIIEALQDASELADSET